jgi:hypothetical protein
MRFVSALHGSVAMRVSADEVTPDRGILPADLISYLEKTYNIKPAFPPNQLAPNAQVPFVLQGGLLKKDTDQYPIFQIVIQGNGDIITAQNTDIAEIILDDYITQLDKGLGFRLRDAKKTFTYLSNIVVQFDDDIQKPLSIFSEIEKIIGTVVKRSEGPFQLKRLAFGQGDPVIQAMMNMDTIDKSDFLLERRADEAYSERKFFSSAPLKLKDHIEVLERIETVLLGRKSSLG